MGPNFQGMGVRKGAGTKEKMNSHISKSKTMCGEFGPLLCQCYSHLKLLKSFSLISSAAPIRFLITNIILNKKRT